MPVRQTLINMADLGAGSRRLGKRAADANESTQSKRPRSSNPKLTFKSPAEFFAENKNIAGFDNPGKSLYTTVRELVENGLDAAEAVPTQPCIQISIECIERDEFRRLVGMEAGRERVDSALYKDVETAKERKKREAKERRDTNKKKQVLTAGSASQGGDITAEGEGGSVEDATRPASVGHDTKPGTQAKEKSGGAEVFRVTVRDNGTGMAHDDVPNMMGRVLTGTKYCVKQSRGKFGLGSKMALIWSKMSTGVPVTVRTAQADSEITTCVLDIDMANNTPTVLRHEKEANPEKWRGSEVQVTIVGNWTTYRAKLLLYMRQMAVITPYAEFRFAYNGGASRQERNFELLFARRTDVMPNPAKEIKHHPSSVDQYRLKRLIAEVGSSMKLHAFLTTQFVSIPPSLATRLINELGPPFTLSMKVSELDSNHVRQLNELLQAARFDKPDGSCLSPAGEYNLRLGITKELQPTMVATHAEPADVFEGHAFVVEAGVALGGSGLKPGITVFRFANRIPLLFESGNDVVTKTAKESIRWASYKISPVTQPIGVVCSIVSTKIPFKGTGKEYIGDDSEAIKAAVKRAIAQCCLQLRSKLVRKAALKDAADRKKSISRYAPDVANAISSVFENVEDADPEVKNVADMFQSGALNRSVLKNKLMEHVEQFDKEQALEFATVCGRDQNAMERIFFAPRKAAEEYQTFGPIKKADANTASECSQLALLPCLRGVL